MVVLFKLAIPIILGNFAYAILNITDVMMAGSCSSRAGMIGTAAAVRNEGSTTDPRKPNRFIGSAAIFGKAPGQNRFRRLS